MKRIIIYVLALLPFAARSQTVMTLDECVRQAKENNKKIKASEWQVLTSQHELHGAKALFFPSFSLTGNVLYSTVDGSYSSGMGQLPVTGSDGVPNGQFALFPGIDLAYDFGWIYGGGIKMEQPIYTGGKIRAGYRMAKIGNEIAVQNRRLTEAEVIVETSRAYADVVRTKELVKVAASYNELLTELMRTVESARKHGLKPQNDVLKVQVKLDESLLNLRRAENGYRLAMMNLCHCMGRPLTDRIETSDTLPETDYAVERGADIENRPEYLILDGKENLAKREVDVAKSEHLPQVGLVGQYGYLNGIDLNGSKLLDNQNFLVGVQVSIPIFNFGRRVDKIKSARAQYAQVQAEREDTDERLTLEMNRSLNDLDEALLERRLAESSVVSAEENLRASRLQYEKGAESLSDHLEAQTLWLQARQTWVETRIDCYLRWLEYRKAIGRIN